MNSFLHRPASLVLAGLALPVLAMAAYVAVLIVPMIVRIVVPIVVEAVFS